MRVPFGRSEQFPPHLLPTVPDTPEPPPQRPRDIEDEKEDEFDLHGRLEELPSRVRLDEEDLDSDDDVVVPNFEPEVADVLQVVDVIVVVVMMDTGRPLASKEELPAVDSFAISRRLTDFQTAEQIRAYMTIRAIAGPT